MLAGAWLGIAHVIGAGIRRVGHDVSDLAPEDRRDGAALFNLALGVFVATFAWWGFQGWLPDLVFAIVNGTFGWMALLLPLMLFVCAFRLFRQPDDGRGNNRVGIGFLIMTFAGSGLAHIIGGQPTVADGFDGLRRAGGMLGYLAAAPLAAVHTAVPVAVYGLLAFTSLLIVTATPFGAIPGRLRDAYEHLMGIDLQDDDGGDRHDRSYLYENDAPAPPRKKRKRLFGKDHDDESGLEGYVGDEAFERALIADEEAADARSGQGHEGQGALWRRSRRRARRRARRPPSHPGRDRRRKDQGRPGPRHGRIRRRCGGVQRRRHRGHPAGHSGDGGRGIAQSPPLRPPRRSPPTRWRPHRCPPRFRSAPNSSPWPATSPTPCRRRTC